MPAVFPAKSDQPGNQRRIAHGTETGSLELIDFLRVGGVSWLDGDVHIAGNLFLSSSTIVDVTSNTIYTFADPVIFLNTTFTDLYIPEAGLRIFRGGGEDVARLLFMENDASRTVRVWKVGVGADILRIARIADSLTDQHAMFWNDSTFSINTHAGINFQPTEAIFSIPTRVQIAAAGGVPYYRFVDAPGKTFDIQNYDTGAEEDAFRFQFTDYTYGTVATTRGADLSTDRMMRFRLRTPANARIKYIFDTVGNFGVDTDGAALLRTDLATFRIEGTTAVHLRAGTAGTSQIEVAASLITFNQDLDMNLNDILNLTSLATINLDCDELTFERMNVIVPTGIDPIPVVGGWGGSITYGGTTYTETSSEVTNTSRYEVKIAFTHAGLPSIATIVAPIHIGTDMDKIRGVYGVMRKMTAPGGSVTQVYGIPTNDIWIQDSFTLNAFLTDPGTLDDYHLLSINVTKLVGDWEILATVVTQLP